MEKRYYYKDDKGNLYNFKTKTAIDNLVEISEEEYKTLTKPKQPTAEQIALQEKQKLIAEKKALLNKYREDIEQVDLFDMERSDYEEKKAMCRQLVLELRELEK